jgi:predicted transcriptional regulator
MITQQKPATDIPTDLRSPQAKLIYLFLSMNGTTSISELQDGLNMKKISLYSILKTLEKDDVVSRNGERYALA